MAVDLSLQHHPVGDLFDISPHASHRLSDAQVEFFHEQGYVAGIDILDSRQLEALRDQLAPLMQAEHDHWADDGSDLWHEYHSNESPNPDKVLFHALGAWRIAAGFHDLLWNPAFTVPARQLLGGPVRFWHDQLFCKPAHHGGVVAWHQDYSYWTRTSPMAHLTCWIGLDDSTRDNGCLHYIPGSHRWELLPVTGLAGDMHAIEQVLDEQQRETFRSSVAIELKAGQAAFHHPLMIHGSFENRTSQPRRAAVINVMRDGVRSNSDEPLLQGAPVIGAGEMVAGRLFPLLMS